MFIVYTRSIETAIPIKRNLNSGKLCVVSCLHAVSGRRGIVFHPSAAVDEVEITFSLTPNSTMFCYADYL